MDKAGILKMQARRLLSRVELRFAVSVVFLVTAVAFIESCIRFYGWDLGAIPSAAYGWAWNMDALQINTMRILAFFLIFIIAASVFADNFFLDTRSGAALYIASRCSLVWYVVSNMILVFIGGFLIILLPLAISQLLAFLVFPLDGTFAGRFNTPIYAPQPSFGNIFPDLIFNHPYLSNFVYMLYASFWAGAMSGLSFALSFFIRKGRLILIGLPTAFALIVWQVVPLLFKNASNMSHFYYLYPNSAVQELSSIYFFAAPLIIIAASLLLIFCALRTRKDVLL